MDNQGNAQMYTIGMKVFGNAHSLITAAPNTYVTRRAVKAWHDARVAMFKRAGVSMKELGYGRSLRPYLDVNHENGTTTEIDSESSSGDKAISPVYTGDEWTYSRAAVATPAESTNDTDAAVFDLVDTYSFTLCDASVAESTTPDSPDESWGGSDQDSFVSVGMLKEWLTSFKKQSVVTDDEDIISDNALLQLSHDAGPQKEEILELAKHSQVEGRPWDLNGATHYSTQYAGTALANGNESGYIVFQAPCGLFNVGLWSESAAQQVYTEFDVLDIQDM